MEVNITCSPPSPAQVVWNDMSIFHARHQARGMWGIQFQALCFCTHCEGQILTSNIPLPFLSVSRSLLTQQCSSVPYNIVLLALALLFLLG